MVYLDRASRPDAVVNATIVGGRIGLGASAIGHVLLADRSREFIAEVVESGIRRYTDATPQTLDDLLEVVERVRKVGYAVAEGFIHPAARGMAAPIYGPDGHVLAGLGVVVPSGGPVDMRIVELLRKAARTISQQMRMAHIDPNHPHAPPGARFRVLINSSKSSMEYFQDVQGHEVVHRGGRKEGL